MARSTNKPELTRKSTLHSKVVRESVVAPKKGRRAGGKTAEVGPAPAKRTRPSRKAAARVESPAVVPVAALESPAVVPVAVLESPAVVPAAVRSPRRATSPVSKRVPVPPAESPVSELVPPVEAPATEHLLPIEALALSSVPVDEEAARKASRLAQIRSLAARRPRPTAALPREEAAPTESAAIPAVTPDAVLSGTLAEVIVLECVPVPEVATDSAGARLEAVELTGAFEIVVAEPTAMRAEAIPAAQTIEPLSAPVAVVEPPAPAMETAATSIEPPPPIQPAAASMASVAPPPAPPRPSAIRAPLLPAPLARRPPPPPPPRRREPMVVKSVRWVVGKLLRWAGR